MAARHTGPEIIKELTPQPGDVVVEGKKTLDAFHSTGLDYYLRANEIEYVAFTGFHTDWCVESSARSAYDKATVSSSSTTAPRPIRRKSRISVKNGFSRRLEKSYISHNVLEKSYVSPSHQGKTASR